MIPARLCWLCLWALIPARWHASAFIVPAHSCSSLFAYDKASSKAVRFATKKKGRKEKATLGGERNAGTGFGVKKGSPQTNKKKPEHNSAAEIGNSQPETHSNSNFHSRIARRKKWRTEEPRDETEETESKVAVDRKNRREKWAQRAETADAREIHTQEYQQQLELAAAPKPGRLIQISQDPLLLTIDDFIDPVACERVQSDGAGCFDLLYPERIADLLFQGQESEMDGLLFNIANSQQHLHKGTHPDGLHMDTNGQCLFRHVTCLLYLNTIPPECGGATIFPLARALPNDPVLAASKRLLEEKISHTRSRAVEEAGLTKEALLLESRVGSNFMNDMNTQTSVRIQPKAGRLLIFFSRQSNGEEDPRAWHSGEQIKSNHNGDVVEKRILTLFKEVQYNPLEPHRAQPSLAQSTFEAFLSPQIQEQQKWLQWKAQDQSLVSYPNTR